MSELSLGVILTTRVVQIPAHISVQLGFAALQAKQEGFLSPIYTPFARCKGLILP